MVVGYHHFRTHPSLEHSCRKNMDIYDSWTILKGTTPCFFSQKTSDVRSSTKKPVRCVVIFQNLWLSQTWQKRNDLLWFLHTFYHTDLSFLADLIHDMSQMDSVNPVDVCFSFGCLGPMIETWREDWTGRLRENMARPWWFVLVPRDWELAQCCSDFSM